jgi:uncharacterized damage-inducible protein DinB
MPHKEHTVLTSKYAVAYEKLKNAVTGLTEEEKLAKPAPGKWCIREILHHLMDSEIMAVGRIKRIIAEENPFLPSYDQEKFAEHLHYTALDPEGALVTFGMLRETTSALLVLLSDEMWERKGNHEQRGTITLEDMITLMVTHAENHIGQILTIRQNILHK